MTSIEDYERNSKRVVARQVGAPMLVRRNGSESLVTLSTGALGGLAVELAEGAGLPLSPGAATEATVSALLSALRPGTWTPAVQVAPADSGIISAAACTVRAVQATNRTAATIWLMLFDAAAVPADGTFPRLPVIAVPAESTVHVPLGALECATGLVWACSSTYGVLTITAATPAVVSAELV